MFDNVGDMTYPKKVQCVKKNEHASIRRANMRASVSDADTAETSGATADTVMLGERWTLAMPYT